MGYRFGLIGVSVILGLQELNVSFSVVGIVDMDFVSIVLVIRKNFVIVNQVIWEKVVKNFDQQKVKLYSRR